MQSSCVSHSSSPSCVSTLTLATELTGIKCKIPPIGNCNSQTRYANNWIMQYITRYASLYISITLPHSLLTLSFSLLLFLISIPNPIPISLFISFLASFQKKNLIGQLQLLFFFYIISINTIIGISNLLEININAPFLKQLFPKLMSDLVRKNTKCVYLEISSKKQIMVMQNLKRQLLI